MYKLVLLRHGESTWNQENRFTGWTDVDLTDKGIAEARAAGQVLQTAGFDFDVVFTSLLTRAIRTAWITLDAMGRMWLPIQLSWRLNERHYGALQGLNKAQTAAQYGDEQVLIWRRSYDIPPPALAVDDARSSAHDPRYGALSAGQIPLTECLKDTVARVLPYWHEQIAPALLARQRPLVVAHGNSMRALIKYLENISDADIVALNIPNGQPLVYELDEQLRVLRRYYLGDAQIIAQASAAVAAQAQHN